MEEVVVVVVCGRISKRLGAQSAETRACPIDVTIREIYLASALKAPRIMYFTSGWAAVGGCD
jgi:hypothetical protein